MKTTRSKVLLGSPHNNEPCPDFIILVPCNDVFITKDARSDGYALMGALFSRVDPQNLLPTFMDKNTEFPCLVNFATKDLDVQFIMPNRDHAVCFVQELCTMLGLVKFV